METASRSPVGLSSTWKAESRSENCALREIAGQSAPKRGVFRMARIALFLFCLLLSASSAWAQAKNSIEKLNADGRLQQGRRQGLGCDVHAGRVCAARRRRDGEGAQRHRKVLGRRS